MVRQAPFGVRQFIAALEYFGLRHASCRFDIFWNATRPVSLLYISDCVEYPYRFGFHYALAPLLEYGTAERSEASTALVQATQVACS